MPPDFVSQCFARIFFTWIWCTTYISGGYHVMCEPRFPSDVYSTWGFSRGSLVHISIRITRDFVPLEKW